MKSKAIILMIFLPVIAVSFLTQKSSARHSPQIKDTTGVAPSVSVRERFLGTWELCPRSIATPMERGGRIPMLGRTERVI